MELDDGVLNCCDETLSDMDSSELKGEESLFAYLIGFGMFKCVKSEKRIKLCKCGYKSGFLGNKGLNGFYEHVL